MIGREERKRKGGIRDEEGRKGRKKREGRKE